MGQVGQLPRIGTQNDTMKQNTQNDTMKQNTQNDTMKQNTQNGTYIKIRIHKHNNKNFIPVTNLMHKFLYSYNITVLYMFRAVLCLSSGGQIVLSQPV